MIRFRRLYESLEEDRVMQAGKEAVATWTNSSLKRKLENTEQIVGGTLVFVARMLTEKFGFELIDCRTKGPRISLVFNVGQEDIDSKEVMSKILVYLTGSPITSSYKSRGWNILPVSSILPSSSICELWAPENFIEIDQEQGKCYFQCVVK